MEASPNEAGAPGALAWLLLTLEAHARGAGLALGAQAVGPAERQRGQAMLGLAGQVRSWVCPGPLGNLLGGG